jgi:hypothetical protein
VSWWWSAVLVGKEFGVLPSVAARHLDSDPDQFDLFAIRMLRFSEAYAIYRRADAKEIESYKKAGGKAMALVEEFDFARAAAELGMGPEA